MNRSAPISEKKANLLLLVMFIIATVFSCSIATAQIHIKDNQSFHLAIGNDGIEIETSRNLYIRAGLSLDKAIGCIGLNISDSYDDQWVNHFGIRLGRIYKLPSAVFGVEYGLDKKLTEKLFIGGRIYNDWTANNIKTESKIGYGIRIGFYL
jgi:hypothetical protein